MQFSGRGFSLPIGRRTYIMGIVNVTPDSFSDGGLYDDPLRAVQHALDLTAQGADLLDIGAQSTRPGYIPVSADEEWTRLSPVLEKLPGLVSVPISIDTYFPSVADRALSAGAHIINDVSGCADPELLGVVARHGAGIIIMHPGDAAQAGGGIAPEGGICHAVHIWLQSAAEHACAAGIPPSGICLDPGIGFGKTMDENLALLCTGAVRVPGYAWLVGASRKRLTVAYEDNPAPPAGRIGGTIAAHTIAQLAGADILRVHNVKEAMQASRLADAWRLMQNQEGSLWISC